MTTPLTPERMPDIPARVLIVDDDDNWRAIGAALLRNSAVECLVADSGADALAKARLWRPDVILLDVMMPGIDGYEVCRRLRADPEIAEVRVFLLTTLEDFDARLTGFEAGADDFLSKPLNRAEMLARVRGVARLNRYRSLLDQHRQLIQLQHTYGSAEESQTPDGDLAPAFDRALSHLYLVFHPIIKFGDAVADQHTFAHECLVRTREPQFPTPAELLAAASYLNRLPEIGRGVRALAENMMETLDFSGTLFINVASHDLEEEVLHDPHSSFTRHAKQIVLELTEREPLDQVKNLRGRLRRLRQLGFRFALDDLGTSHSSLNGLAVIEPEFVKLDRDLIQGVADEPVRQSIVRSMGALCRDLGITLIVEGVETEAECRALLSLRCAYQQGWVFGKPTATLDASAR